MECPVGAATKGHFRPAAIPQDVNKSGTPVQERKIQTGLGCAGRIGYAVNKEL